MNKHLKRFGMTKETSVGIAVKFPKPLENPYPWYKGYLTDRESGLLGLLIGLIIGSFLASIF